MVIKYRPQWTFKKHKSNFWYYVYFALFVKSHKYGLSKSNRESMYKDLEKKGYNPRSKKMKLSSIDHRLDELRNYMFGYFNTWGNSRTFVMSPLGNLLLRHLKNTKDVSKIFATMLYSIQFPTTGNNFVNDCNIRPFRLIFKLLEDRNLNYKLYNLEVENILFFITNTHKHFSYNKLVQCIKHYRKTPIGNIWKHMTHDQDKYNRHYENEKKHRRSKNKYSQLNVINRVYEWQYYTMDMLTQSKVFIKRPSTIIGQLNHPKNATSKTITKRYVTNDYFELSNTVEPLISKLLKNYPYNEKTVPLSNKHQLTSNSINQIYSFYPKELLTSINEPNTKKYKNISKILQLPNTLNSIRQHLKALHEFNKNASFKNNKTAKNYEKDLTELFNMFNNVSAIHLGEKGQTDVECSYTYYKRKKHIEKFDADAKSTTESLHGLNAKRLKVHRDKVHGKYTIVVTPEYDPIVSNVDIKNNPIALIKSRTLSTYMYNYLESDKKIDYSHLNKIILNHLGEDVSDELYKLTLRQFGSTLQGQNS